MKKQKNLAGISLSFTGYFEKRAGFFWEN